MDNHHPSPAPAVFYDDQFAPPPINFSHAYGIRPGERRPQMVEDPGPYGTPIPRYAQQGASDDWIPAKYLEKGKSKRILANCI